MQCHHAALSRCHAACHEIRKNLMAFQPSKLKEVAHTLDDFISRIRPSAEIRHHLDLGYEIDNQCVYL